MLPRDRKGDANPTKHHRLAEGAFPIFQVEKYESKLVVEEGSYGRETTTLNSGQRLGFEATYCEVVEVNEHSSPFTVVLSVRLCSPAPGRGLAYCRLPISPHARLTSLTFDRYLPREMTTNSSLHGNGLLCNAPRKDLLVRYSSMTPTVWAA